MSRYCIRLANWVAPRDEEMGRDTPPKSGALLASQVYESEPAPHDTGLLDANGNKIMRNTPERKIGYVTF